MSKIEIFSPLFSIVIPSYNRAGSITRTIQSCLRQDFQDFEVVVLDDGSKDDTAAVVAAIGDPRIQYCRQENAGASAARNRGAEYARGRFIAFLDSDDEFLPEKLSVMQRVIEQARDEAYKTVFYSQLVFRRGEGNEVIKPAQSVSPSETIGEYLFANNGIMQTSTLVIPRVLFLKARFNPAMRNLEDLDLCLRLEEVGAKFVMVPQPLVIWHDDTDVGRLSYETTAKQVEDWAKEQRPRLSDRAYYGFLARYAVPVIARSNPQRAARILVKALRHGGVRPARAGALAMRGTMPETYARLRDAIVRARHKEADEA